MKIIAVSILFFISTLCCSGKMNGLNNDDKLHVDRITGTNEDIKKVLFLLKTNKSIDYNKLRIQYHADLDQLFFLHHNRVVAYYNVKKGQAMTINNKLPLRDKLSFNDLNEREYQIKIELKNNKTFILRIENYGNKNKLDKGLTIYAHNQSGNFSL